MYVVEKRRAMSPIHHSLAMSRYWTNWKQADTAITHMMMMLDHSPLQSISSADQNYEATERAAGERVDI